MKIYTIALVIFFIALVALKIYSVRRKNHLDLITCSAKCSDEERDRLQEIIAEGLEKSDRQSEEEIIESFRQFDEDDFDRSANHIILYDEENDVIIIPTIIMARIASGDLELCDKVIDYVNSIPGNQAIMIADVAVNDGAA